MRAQNSGCSHRTSFVMLIRLFTVASVLGGEIDESKKSEEDGSRSPEGDVLEDSHHVVSVVREGPEEEGLRALEHDRARFS